MRNWRCGLAFVLVAGVLAFISFLVRVNLALAAANISLFVGLGFLVLGIWFIYLPDVEICSSWKKETEPKIEYEEPHSIVLELPKEPADLSGDEKRVYGLLASNGRLIQQSEIVQKTGLSKVKVTRILNRFELDGLIERKRQGLKNLVVLK